MSDQAQLEVVDTTASPTYPERTHEIVDGEGVLHAYTFSLGKRLLMPAAHAMQFLKTESFELYKPNSFDRILPNAKAEAAPGGQVIMEPGTVVARLDELTNDALANRANQYPGGEHFRRQHKKDEIIEFLLEQEGNSTVDEGESEGSVDRHENLDGGDFMPSAFSDEELGA